MKVFCLVLYLLGPGKILLIVLVLMAIAIAQRRAPSWTPQSTAPAADTIAGHSAPRRAAANPR